MSDDNLKIEIDYISSAELIDKGYLAIIGWCICDEGKITEISLACSGKVLAKAGIKNINPKNDFRYGFSRLEISNLLPERIAKNSYKVGFMARLQEFDVNGKFELIAEIALVNSQKITKGKLDLKLEEILSKYHNAKKFTNSDKVNFINHIAVLRNSLQKKKLNKLAREAIARVDFSKFDGCFYNLSSPTELILNNGVLNIEGWFCDSDGKGAKKIVIHVNDKSYSCNRQNNTKLQQALKEIGINAEAKLCFSKSIFCDLEHCIYKLEIITQAGKSLYIDAGLLKKVRTNKKNNEGEKLKQIQNRSAVLYEGKKHSYQDWLNAHKRINFNYHDLHKEIALLKNKPLISLIFPIINIAYESTFLAKMLESIFAQTYTNWQICIVAKKNDEPTITDIKDILASNDKHKELAERVHIKKINSDATFSQACNLALAETNGDSVVMLDKLGILENNALLEFTKIINQKPSAEIIYADEDKIDDKFYRSEPFFKPAWSPDYFLSFDYLSNFVLIKRKILKQIKGFRDGFEGAEIYDVLLQTTEKTKKIHHINKIIFSQLHKEKISNKTYDGSDSFTETARIGAIKSALTRRKIKADVMFTKSPKVYRIKHEIVNAPMVSIIIPTIAPYFDAKNKITFIYKTLESILQTNTYENYEILVIDNGSLDKAQFNDLKFPEGKLKKLTYKYHPKNFNMSEKLHFGFKKSKGEHILLLNDDIVFFENGWLEAMIEYSQLEHVALVGSKLFFPSGKIQHAGVINPNCCPGHIFYNKSEEDCNYFHNLECVSNFSAITGACMMIKRKIYEELNGWHPEFPVCYNDVDFCLRARELGYFNVFTPFSVGIHFESSSREAGAKKEEIERFQNKWLSKLPNDEYYNKNLTTDGLYQLSPEVFKYTASSKFL